MINKAFSSGEMLGNFKAKMNGPYMPKTFKMMAQNAKCLNWGSPRENHKLKGLHFENLNMDE